MRIDSSSIGMESARRYSSASGRVTRLMIGSGRQSLTRQSGFLSGNLLGENVDQEDTQTKDKENVNEDLRSRLEEMQSKLRGFGSGSIRSMNTEDARKQLQDIRQQCIVFLMDLLFPGRSRNTVHYYKKYSYYNNLSLF